MGRPLGPRGASGPAPRRPLSGPLAPRGTLRAPLGILRRPLSTPARMLSIAHAPFSTLQPTLSIPHASLSTRRPMLSKPEREPKLLLAPTGCDQSTRTSAGNSEDPAYPCSGGGDRLTSARVTPCSRVRPASPGSLRRRARAQCEPPRCADSVADPRPAAHRALAASGRDVARGAIPGAGARRGVEASCS